MDQNHPRRVGIDVRVQRVGDAEGREQEGKKDRQARAAAGGPGVQRFFALFGAADFFRAPPRALFFFRPAPFGFDPARRRVATSSCRCSDPIMRPSDSAERSSSDSSSRDRLFAIPTPSRGPGALNPELSKARASLFRSWIARARNA